MHPLRSQHAQVRRVHVPNCLLFLQHFWTSRRFLTQRRCSRCLLLCLGASVTHSTATQRTAANAAAFLHLPASCGTLTITSSSLLSRHSIPNRLMHSRPAQTPQALATPLVGAACHFAHCPQHCSACTLYFRRMCTNSSSPVCQQHHHRQTTQGFGAGQPHFRRRRTPGAGKREGFSVGVVRSVLLRSIEVKVRARMHAASRVTCVSTAPLRPSSYASALGTNLCSGRSDGRRDQQRIRRRRDDLAPMPCSIRCAALTRRGF